MSEKDNNTVDTDDKQKKDGDDLDLEEEEDEDLEDDDKGDDEDEDLDKPLTKKDLLSFEKNIDSKINSRFAGRRHDNKSSKNYSKDHDKSKDDPLDSRLSAIEVSNAKREFGDENGLSINEVNLVYKFTGGKLSKKALEDPFIQGGLEKLRSSQNLKNNITSGSGASTFEVEGKKWDDLDENEKKVNFGARQKSILASKKK